MPRSSRIDAPGVLNHVIIRGIERKKIFRDDKDKDDFVRRLEDLMPETQTCCYAWVLMDNHAHFLFRSGPAGLSVLMRRLLTGYAVRFNRRHRRHGQLFQNRYKSIICQEDSYLKQLVRYIHLNPLRAKMVEDIESLNSYRYSGHLLLAGKGKCDWQDGDYVLRYFDKIETSARKRYLAYVKAGGEMGRRPELVGGGLVRSHGGWVEIKKLRLKGMDRIKGDERILGDSDFVMSILSQANERFERGFELKQKGYDMDHVARRVADIFKIDAKDLFCKGRWKPLPDARALFCCWCSMELGIAQAKISSRLGITATGVSHAVKRGHKLVKQNRYRLIMEITD